MNQAFICDAVRTPFGRFGGARRRCALTTPAALPLKALLARNPGLDPSRIDDVIFGCANRCRGRQPQRGADGAAAGRPAGERAREHHQPPVRFQP